MPGFMPSFKSPFNPSKKNATVITPAEVVAPAEEATIAQEPTSSQVLPGGALVQQTSSTVALTLTPANGESSQQVTSDEADAIPTEEPVAQSDLPVETEPIPEQTVDSAESTPAEAAQDAPEEAALQPPVSEPDVAVVEPLAVAVAPTLEPEAVEPQASVEDSQPNEELPSDAVAPSEDAALAVVSGETTNDVTEGEAPKPAAKANKDIFSCNLKRNKSKKQKAEASTEVAEAGQSVPPKPRKSHPLAGKFRNVIEQVKSKVKKDKEAALTPPAVEVVEPTPIVEEVAASA